MDAADKERQSGCVQGVLTVEDFERFTRVWGHARPFSWLRCPWALRVGVIGTEGHGSEVKAILNPRDYRIGEYLLRAGYSGVAVQPLPQGRDSAAALHN